MFYPSAILPALFAIATLVVACLPSTPPAPEVPACAVTRVVDGDTVDMACDGAVFRARLTGFDTPETYEPGCDAEAALGRQATARLRHMVGMASAVGAEVSGTDRYGRHLVRLSLDGRDVAQAMIAESLAVPYRGGRRIDWCDRLS